MEPQSHARMSPAETSNPAAGGNNLQDPQDLARRSAVQENK